MSHLITQKIPRYELNKFWESRGGGGGGRLSLLPNGRLCSLLLDASFASVSSPDLFFLVAELSIGGHMTSM